MSLIGGLLLTIAGLSFFLGAFGYGIGTLDRILSGFAPLAVGTLTIAVGVAITVRAYVTRGGETVAEEDSDWRALVCVLASVAAFALLVPFGLIPAIVGSTILASIGDRDTTFFSAAISCIAISLLVYVVFVWMVGLRMPLIAGVL